MLVNMLGIKPEELKGALTQIQVAAQWFKSQLETVAAQQTEILNNQRVICAQLERLANGPGNGSGNGHADGGTLPAPGAGSGA